MLSYVHFILVPTVLVTWSIFRLIIYRRWGGGGGGVGYVVSWP